MNFSFNFPLFVVVVLLFAGLTSCQKDLDEDGSATYLFEVVSGNNQKGMPGENLPDQVVIRVIDKHGKPQPGITIRFVPGPSSGTVFPQRGISDQNGMIKTSWTLGLEGSQGLLVTATKEGPAYMQQEPTFPKQVYIVKNSPLGISASFETFSIEKLSGDNQQGYPGSPLPEPIKIRVVNSKGEPQPNVDVIFEGGNVTPGHHYYPILTNQDGIIETIWRLHQAVNQELKVTFTPPDGIGTTNRSVTFTANINCTVVAEGYDDPGIYSAVKYMPQDVFVDAAGNLFVADAKRRQIEKWYPGATSAQVVGKYLEHPEAIFLDAAGTIYVADKITHKILKFTSASLYGVTVAGGNGQGSGANQLNSPSGVAVDAAGNIYIADTKNNRIQKWAPGATSGVTVAGNGSQGMGAHQLSWPAGIYLDASGNLLVADENNHRIQKFAPGATNAVTVAGGNGPGQSNHQLNLPTGIRLDGTGNMYIFEKENYRTQKWAPGATAGVQVASGGGEGRATVDAAGNIYVAEGYERVTKWQP